MHILFRGNHLERYWGFWWGQDHAIDFGGKNIMLFLQVSNFSVFFFSQSLLAALGSIQFVSNIAFAYFVLNKTVTVKYVWSLTYLERAVFQNNWAFSFFIPFHDSLNLINLLFYRVLIATSFIVLGNIFLVAFGNHQSPGKASKWKYRFLISFLYFLCLSGCCWYLLCFEYPNCIYESTK